MLNGFEIGMICYYENKAIDILLPYVSEDELSKININSIERSLYLSKSITLFSRFQNGERRSETIKLPTALNLQKVAILLIHSKNERIYLWICSEDIHTIVELPDSLCIA